MFALQKNITLIICRNRDFHVDLITHKASPPSLSLCQHFGKQLIVVVYAIIEVDLNVLVGKVMDFFFVFLDLKGLLLKLFLLLCQLHALGCTGVVDCVRNVHELGAVTLLLLVNIVSAHPGKKITLIPVHIDERLEAVLFAAVEEPVDRAFLIDFQVIGIEALITQEIATDNLTRRSAANEDICDKLEFFFQLTGQATAEKSPMRFQTNPSPPLTLLCSQRQYLRLLQLFLQREATTRCCPLEMLLLDLTFASTLLPICC